MAVKRDSFQERLSMKPKRKIIRAKYHISKLNLSLKDSLIVFVSVVIRDTISPKTQIGGS